MKSIYLLAISLLMTTAIFADDGYIGSEGGNVYLSKSEDIQMVKEIVRVKMEKDNCLVHCRFWFYNKTKANLHALVGFPNYYYTPGTGSLPITDFTCAINGASIKVDEKKEIDTWIDTLDTGKQIESIDTLESGKFWFTWPTIFAANDTTIIDNEYVAKWGATNYGLKSFDYLLGTGRSWDGPIVDGTIIVVHSQIASSDFISVSYTDTNRIQINYMRDSTQLVFHNLTPNDQEGIEINVICFWDDPYNDGINRPMLPADSSYYFAVYKETIFEHLKRKGANPQDLINEIYARRGYIFSNVGLQDYFSHMAWYKPNKNFSQRDFSMYEKLTINYLKEYGNLK
jgi:hypothetical protein